MDNSSSNTPQRPMLKKIKRPKNRMPNHQPFAQTQTQNPFDSFQNNGDLTSNLQASKEQPQIENSAFDLDKFLDEPQLPSLNNNFKHDEELIENDYIEDGQSYSQIQSSNLPPYLTKSVLLMIGAVLILIGIICGKLFFTKPVTTGNGLQGVVVNPEIPKGRARCGIAERNQGCVLYIMNPQRQEMNARDFYDLASQLSGRQRFVIETGNMRYSNIKIRPGEIVQLNIPPL